MNIIRAAWHKLTGAETTSEQLVATPNPDLMRYIAPGAQSRWLGLDVASYTPQRVAQIYSMAVAGDLQSQWEMFDLMESTWPELAKNLNQLKDEVWLLFLQGEVEVKPFCRKGEEPTPEAERRAALVEEALWNMRPRPEADENDGEDTIRDLLDARGKGISVLEVDWELRRGLASLDGGAGIVPRCTHWVHPQWYGYPGGKNTLMLRVDGLSNPGYAGTHREFPQDKFLIGICKNKTGHPLGNAMLHVLTFWWAASNFTSDWFLNFAQVYGQPLRWATYDPAMTVGDQSRLQAMLQGMGSSAWGMFPEGTHFELKEAAKGAGDNVHAALLAVANKVCDLVVLRQTLTSDVSQNAGSRAQGEVHERVQNKVVLVCALWAAKTLQQLVRSICRLNFGNDSECPFIGLKDDDGEDPKALSEVLLNLSNCGLEVPDDELEELGQRLGIKVQRKAATEIAPAPPIGPRPAMMHPGQDPEDEETPEAPEDPAEKPKPEQVQARSARQPDAVDAIAARRAKVMGEAYKGAMAPFRQAILESTSAEDAIERVSKAYADWNPERIAAEVEEALQLCAAEGAGK